MHLTKVKLFLLTLYYYQLLFNNIKYNNFDTANKTECLEC